MLDLMSDFKEFEGISTPKGSTLELFPSILGWNTVTHFGECGLSVYVTYIFSVVMFPGYKCQSL